MRRAVIFANGELPTDFLTFFKFQPDDFILAVDGGLRHLKACGRAPDLLIGDLDSVDPVEVTHLENLGVEVKRFPVDKDETDLELAMLEAVDRGFDNLVMAGVLGGRLDHTLTNLNLLMLPELTGRSVVIESGAEEVFLIRQAAPILGAPGDLVSLIPLKADVNGVTTTGLRYPLKYETLKLVRSRGVSNVMLANEASVDLESGILLCVHTRQIKMEKK
jgi:thiamine pyrophosphokinase